MYEYLEHTSDVCIHVTSESLEQLFSESAEAASEIMLNTRLVERRRLIPVEMEARDLEQLLYLWIDRMIYHFDADSFALSFAEVEKVEVGGMSKLSAVLWGDEYDPLKHGQRTGLKAMTYSLMRIYNDCRAWHAYFVVDI